MNTAEKIIALYADHRAAGRNGLEALEATVVTTYQAAEAAGLDADTLAHVPAITVRTITEHLYAQAV